MSTAYHSEKRFSRVENCLTSDSNTDSGDDGDGDGGGGGGGSSEELPPPAWRASAMESDDDDDDNDYVGEILACPKRVPSGLAVRPLSSSPSLPLFVCVCLCVCSKMCRFTL
jgi:hypothetical protein